MAIEIIKQGRLPEDIRYHFHCNHCATEFLATPKDGNLKYDQREGNCLEIHCPLCNHECFSWREYKEPASKQTRGWNDYIIETQSCFPPGSK